MKKICVVGLALALMMGGMVSSVSATPYVSGNFGLVSASDASLSGEAGNAGELSMDKGFGFLAAIGPEANPVLLISPIQSHPGR